MTKLVSACLGVLMLVAVAAEAQTYDADFFARLQAGTPVTGRAGCVWQWNRSTVGPWGGWYHACQTPEPPPVPTADPCAPWPSPYVERERFLACLATRREDPGPADDAAPVSVYQVGMRYWDGYPSRKIIVLAVALGVDGTPHVLAQWLTTNGNGKAGDTFTFSANEHQPWMRYRGGEQ